jgi:hypothetical protein
MKDYPVNSDNVRADSLSSVGFDETWGDPDLPENLKGSQFLMGNETVENLISGGDGFAQSSILRGWEKKLESVLSMDKLMVVLLWLRLVVTS